MGRMVMTLYILATLSTWLFLAAFTHTIRRQSWHGNER